MKSTLAISTFVFLSLGILSCSNNDDPDKACDNPESYLFAENDSLIQIEIEDGFYNTDSTDWVKKQDDEGESFLVWEGEDLFNKPGESVIEYHIKVSNPGTYQFIWRSSVTKGNQGSEHNDSWLRFTDASDFYGQKNDRIVYPKDTGKTPNPNGSSKDGWFKVYRSGNDFDFKWQASTSDNEGLTIYVKFDTPGIYTMQVSGRSSGHAIDKFMLFQEDKYSKKEATEVTDMSEMTCN